MYCLTVLDNDSHDHFAKVARLLRDEPDEMQTLDKAIQVAPQIVTGCDYAGITLVSQQQRVETPAATSDVARRSDRLQHDLQEGPCLDALRWQGTIFSTDLRDEVRWPVWAPRVAQELGVRSLLCFQLFTTKQSLGALSLYSERVDAFDAHDHATGLAFAAHIAVALAASRDIDNNERAMLHRTVIGQAEGLLMERYDITADQAFTVLKRLSQDGNIKLRRVAQQIVDEYARSPAVDPVS
jgi:hypothetical protein